VDSEGISKDTGVSQSDTEGILGVSEDTITDSAAIPDSGDIQAVMDTPEHLLARPDMDMDCSNSNNCKAVDMHPVLSLDDIELI